MSLHCLADFSPWASIALSFASACFWFAASITKATKPDDSIGIESRYKDKKGREIYINATAKKQDQAECDRRRPYWIGDFLPGTAGDTGFVLTQRASAALQERPESPDTFPDRQELLHGCCKAKLSCEINPAGATFSVMGTALRLAA